MSAVEDLTSSSEGSYAKSWVSWFLSSKGNEYFCEVDDEYILDRFNLTGLNTVVRGYNTAFELVTDSLGASLSCSAQPQFTTHTDTTRCLQPTTSTTIRETKSRHLRAISTVSSMRGSLSPAEGSPRWCVPSA